MSLDLKYMKIQLIHNSDFNDMFGRGGNVNLSEQLMSPQNGAKQEAAGPKGIHPEKATPAKADTKKVAKVVNTGDKAKTTTKRTQAKTADTLSKTTGSKTQKAPPVKQPEKKKDETKVPD